MDIVLSGKYQAPRGVKGGTWVWSLKEDGLKGNSTCLAIR